MTSHYVELVQVPSMKFEPISKVLNVFYDEVNTQILMIKNASTEVIVRGPEHKLNVRITVPHEKGVINSIKFSPDQNLLSVLRSQKNIDLVQFGAGRSPNIYNHFTKGKQQIYQFYWTYSNELIVITNTGFECYTWLPDLFKLKLIKSFNLKVVRWYHYNCQEHVLLIPSSNPSSVTIHTFLIKRGSHFIKIPDFDIECYPNVEHKYDPIQEGNITVISAYSCLFIIAVKNYPAYHEIGAEMILYKIEVGQVPSPTYVLKLDVSGVFAVNTTDNLIIIHHQGSKITLLFDIMHYGRIVAGRKVLDPVVPPLPMAPTIITSSSYRRTNFDIDNTFANQTGTTLDTSSREMYSKNWVIFQPNNILDVKWGLYMEVWIKLDVICHMMTDRVKLIEFLLRRGNSQSVLMSVFGQSLTPGRQASIYSISKMFDKLNEAYVSQKNREKMSNLSTLSFGIEKIELSLISQEEMYRQVFSTLEGFIRSDYKFVFSVLMEYIRSLHHHQLEVEHYLYEMVIGILVEHAAYAQLHQLLQYHVIADSKPIACVLLSFENKYKPALQLALDMFKRLSTADEEIIEVLLSHNQIIPALRYIRTIGKTDIISARVFLNSANKSNDKMLFYAVYKFFEERNLRLRKTEAFPQEEHCNEYEKIFLEYFEQTEPFASVYSRKILPWKIIK